NNNGPEEGMMSRRFSRGRLVRGGVLTGFACAMLATEVAAQHNPSAPDFSSNQVGWVTTGEIMGVPGGPPILRQDPSHAYVPNNIGRQPTYRIADLTNPNLKPWIRERMKKDNDEGLAGKIAFTARSSCMPAGVHAVVSYPVLPCCFIPTSPPVAM